MRLIESSIRNPIAVCVAVLLVCLFGGMSLAKLPLQLFPDIDRPNITIFTGWRAASPEEAEAQLLEPQEQVEVMTIVNLSSVSVRRTAAFAAASAILSGGMLAVVPSRTPMYLVMTDRHLFVFRANSTFARPEAQMIDPKAPLR